MTKRNLKTMIFVLIGLLYTCFSFAQKPELRQGPLAKGVKVTNQVMFIGEDETNYYSYDCSIKTTLLGFDKTDLSLKVDCRPIEVIDEDLFGIKGNICYYSMVSSKYKYSQTDVAASQGPRSLQTKLREIISDYDGNETVNIIDGKGVFGIVAQSYDATQTKRVFLTIEQGLFKSNVQLIEVERKLPHFTPIQVTSIVPNKDLSYAAVWSCMSDTVTIGYLFVPKEDELSTKLFNRSVTEDLGGDSVGISPKRFVPNLVDVQQAESVLAEVMRDGVLPKMGPYYRNIGNPDNYTKYERTYGFYYNEKEEKCVYIQMELSDPSFPRFYVGFSKLWDGCDTEVYINLNLEKHEVIRAYSSTCPGY